MPSGHVIERKLRDGTPRYHARIAVGGRGGKVFHGGSFETRELADARVKLMQAQVAEYGTFDIRNADPSLRRRRKQLPAAIRFEVLYRAGFACQYCGARAPEVRLQVDHIKPVVNGGDDSLENLAVACFQCNIGKHNRFLVMPRGFPVMAPEGVLYGEPPSGAAR